jgi:hypothetical protein
VDEEPLTANVQSASKRRSRIWTALGRSPKVTVDHVPGRSVDQDLGYPVNLAEGAGQGSLLLGRMAPPVARVGHELGRRDVGVADDSVAPGAGWRLCRHLKPGLASRPEQSESCPSDRQIGGRERKDHATWQTCANASARPALGSRPTRHPWPTSRSKPSQKDGLGRMCKVHWNQYTAGLARDAKAEQDAPEPAETTPAAIEAKPRRAKAKASKPIADNEESSAE